jgi:hypothetical protein
MAFLIGKRNQHIQCNLILEQKLKEKSNVRSIPSQCNIKPSQRSKLISTTDLVKTCDVGSLAAEPRSIRHVAVNTALDVSGGIDLTVFEKVIYALRTIPEFETLRYEVCVYKADVMGDRVTVVSYRVLLIACMKCANVCRLCLNYMFCNFCL